MKKVINCLFLSFAFATNLSAESFSGIGTVNMIGVNSYDVSGPARSTYFTINDFKVAGNCSLHGGLVTLRLPEGEGGNRQLSLITAAQLAGKRIKVSIDDTRTDGSTTCVVSYVQLLGS